MSSEQQEFDHYADRYELELESALRGSGTSADFFARTKADRLVRDAARRLGDVATLRVLDIGCGVGSLHPHLVDRVGELVGVDVAEQALERARRENPEVTYVVNQGSALPFDDARFDIVLATCVLHHVPPAEWPKFLEEMHRVLVPGGMAAIFEHNPYNPATRFIVSRCSFDEDAVLLSPKRTRQLMRGSGLAGVHTAHLFFLAPFFRTRFLLEAAHAFDRSLSWLPIGAQYRVVAQRPKVPFRRMNT